MLNFITLFDKNYMSRGIVLYNSLKENCTTSFNLYVLALDDVVKEHLGSLNRSNLIVVTVQDLKVMYPVLECLEQERTRGEFCWTLSSFSVQYAIRYFGLRSCIYVDSDVCFYDDPQVLLAEMSNESVMITEHNYTPEYDQSTTSGKFCVQFMYFKNNEDGNKVLEWWRSRCEEWCYNRMEDGKFGDQKYLDDWESRFEGIVYNCRNIGCGVAPWNVQKYIVTLENDKPYVMDRITKVKKRIVFFHYHELTGISETRWCLSHYRLDEAEKEILYKYYISELHNIENQYSEGMIKKRGKSLKYSLYKKIRLFLGYLKRYPAYFKKNTEVYRNIMEV